MERVIDETTTVPRLDDVRETNVNQLYKTKITQIFLTIHGFFILFWYVLYSSENTVLPNQVRIARYTHGLGDVLRVNAICTAAPAISAGKKNIL